MAEVRTYARACHCDEVRYEGATDLARVMDRDGSKRVSIDGRCLDDVEVGSPTVTSLDGRRP